MARPEPEPESGLIFWSHLLPASFNPNTSAEHVPGLQGRNFGF